MLNHRQKRTDEQMDHECGRICFVSGGHGMAERRRGTQGRPMIYGKSPESRRYWNITPEDQKTLPNSKASVNDTATEKDPAAEAYRSWPALRSKAIPGYDHGGIYLAADPLH